jgi:hypothetical protein
MPPLGEKKGFKIGRNERRYWIASQARRSGTMDFPDKTVELPADVVTDEQITEFCALQNARLDAWIEQQTKALEGGSQPETRTRYDGSVQSGCRVFQEHALSPFNTKMKFNTQKTCLSFLKLIEATGGSNMFRNVTVPLVQSWYQDWRAPDFEGDIEHVKRAHEGVSILRQVIYFLAAMRKYEGVSKLAAELKLVTFERPTARTQAITYAHAVAFCRAAEELVQLGKIRPDRALYAQIGVMAQFELMLRERDIIGEWAKNTAKRRLPVGITVIERGEEAWAGYFTWEGIPGWRWVMKTSKSRYREAGDFRLQNYGLLFPLLERVPREERTGAIVKGEHGLPARARTYSDDYRAIALLAGFPKDLWKMDSRAGGATEADEAGAEFTDIQGALTHKSAATTRRYVRSGPGRKIEAVAEARARKRAGDEGGTS